MNVKKSSKTAEEAIIENDTETKTVKTSRVALIGVKKGAEAAKQTVSKIASAPSRIFESAVYGACYGISYGAVFTSLVILKIVPANSLVTKGFHDGAEVARKDFKIHQEKHVVLEDSIVATETF